MPFGVKSHRDSTSKRAAPLSPFVTNAFRREVPSGLVATVATAPAPAPSPMPFGVKSHRDMTTTELKEEIRDRSPMPFGVKSHRDRIGGS